MKRLIVGLLAGSLLAVTACSAQPPMSDNNQVISQSCQVIVTELKTTGMSLAELIPVDLATVDASVLSKAYSVGGAALDRAATQTADVKVGDVLGTAAGAMKELSPIIELAATGDVGALRKAAVPLGQLAGIATQCSTAVMK